MMNSIENENLVSHRVETLACTICNRTVQCEHDLQNHKYTLIECKECHKSFKHYLCINTDEQPYTCTQNTSKFSTFYELKIPRRLHLDERPYSCTQCDHRFAHKSSLYRHLRAHTDEKLYKCTQCPKKFPTPYELKRHMKRHTGERPFSCLECDQRFASKYDRNIHHRVHTGEKPFSCSQCDRQFARKYHLTVHIRVHTGEKPYCCTQCDRQFAYDSSLRLHMRIHSGDRPYKCEFCSKEFYTSTHLNRHKQRIHMVGEKFYSGTAKPKSILNQHKDYNIDKSVGIDVTATTITTAEYEQQQILLQSCHASEYGEESKRGRDNHCGHTVIQNEPLDLTVQLKKQATIE